MLLIFSLLFPPSTASIIVFICLEYLLLTLVAKSNGDIFWGAAVGFFPGGAVGLALGCGVG